MLEQDYPRLEYFVIDGGSTDDSPQILARYAGRLAYWESQPDRGQAHAINKGLQRSQGEILGWLNSDDVLLPGVVSRAVQVFAQNPQVEVVYGRLERIDAIGRLLPTPIATQRPGGFRPEPGLGRVCGEPTWIILASERNGTGGSAG